MRPLPALPISRHATFVRCLLAIPLALLLCLLVFKILASLTDVRDHAFDKQSGSPALNFLLVAKESAPEYRNRQIPEPEEIIQQPSDFNPADPTTTKAVDLDIQAPTLSVPTIDFAVNVQLSSSLANQGPPQIADNLNLTPFQNNPGIVKRIDPRYPSKALRRKIEGRVTAEFIVGTKGYAQDDSIKIIDEEPAALFSSSVIRSIKRSKFETMTKNGQTVAYRTQKTYLFQLPKK
ncbi:energy transducer TonB [Aestuariirhabdus haliotis]|uniref:energy transducer TonB n=1 Tax=Aestuariirhabdus haliotis TaxID=2918751 RepID=UPI0020BF6ADF|nr:energy transducer TonB [Aestuariirhabdus haliotis]MCL6420597.1 energy transducer TonB [Aestuariirhabdus haliotis]